MCSLTDSVIHMEYTNIGLPKTFSTRFWKIAHFWGYRSFSEFAVAAVRDKILEMEKEFEKAQEEKEE